MTAREIARMLNVPGENHHNCCQSTFAALAEGLGFDMDTAIRIGSCFGGGMMRGEVCGALIGPLMYIGLKYGPSEETRKRGQALIDAFQAAHGTLLCRELLASVGGDGAKICPMLVAGTVDLALGME